MSTIWYLSLALLYRNILSFFYFFYVLLINLSCWILSISLIENIIFLNIQIYLHKQLLGYMLIRFLSLNWSKCKFMWYIKMFNKCIWIFHLIFYCVCVLLHKYGLFIVLGFVLIKFYQWSVWLIVDFFSLSVHLTSFCGS